MGKKRVALVGEKSAIKKSPRVRTAGLKGGERVVMVGGGAEAKEIKKDQRIGEKEESLEKEKKGQVAEEKKEVKRKRKKPKIRGKKYQKARAAVKAREEYPLKEAVKLLKKTSVSRFTGAAEAHIVVGKVGLTAKIKFPYGDIGKKKVVAIADDKETLKKIQKGKIDFDILLASPKMMPKLIPYARILGPRGLMPNLKNKTVVADPQKAIKEIRSSGLSVKTEKKAPLIHTVFGKVDQKDQQLEENLEALIKGIGRGNIRKLTICATMGPGIRVSVGRKG